MMGLGDPELDLDDSDDDLDLSNPSDITQAPQRLSPQLLSANLYLTWSILQLQRSALVFDPLTLNSEPQAPSPGYSTLNT
mmetsp:Transcript_23230/g.36333  ORF Transcript_23230/g.36333 Transcript_23230/m.36333 type:complete len:80 (+) Transcript_23230:188-427(+)